MKTPTITRVAPVCFTPNPRLTPNPSTEEISSNTYPQVVSSELVDSNSNSVIKSYAELLQDAEEDAGDGISVIDSYPEPRPEPADLDSSLSRADRLYQEIPFSDSQEPISQVRSEQEWDTGLTENVSSVDQEVTHTEHIITCPRIKNSECNYGLRINCINQLSCIKKHHNEEENQLLSKYVSYCDLCQKAFATKTGLKIHNSRKHLSPIEVSPNVNDGSSQVVEQENTPKAEGTMKGVRWGNWKGKPLIDKVDAAYLETVRWRRNLFQVPTGKAGQQFIEEITFLLNEFNNGSTLEPIALTLMMLAFPLLLQKPSRDSKAKDHSTHLERRMKLWKDGNLDDLLSECRAVQQRINNPKKKTKEARKYRRFINLMEHGRISAALKCIGSQQASVLDISEEVLDELRKNIQKLKKLM